MRLEAGKAIRSWPRGDATPVSFGLDFAPRFIVTVDTEEEFDWNGPFTRDDHGLAHVAAIPRFQAFCQRHRVAPIYLVDFPIANDARASEMLRSYVGDGTAAVGVQLHPWVSPPFAEPVSDANSYACNLTPELERAKLMRLFEEIEANIGVKSQIYRAGRYGAGANAMGVLRELGVRIDSSVRSLFDYRNAMGPDYLSAPLVPYWLQRGILAELPLTTVFGGHLRHFGHHAFPVSQHSGLLRAGFARAGLIERIALTPEGIPAEKACEAIDLALAKRLPVLNFSFHSPSLAPGHTPYVRDERDLDMFYAWWVRVFAHLERRGVAPVALDDLVAHMFGASADKRVAPRARSPLSREPAGACSSVG